MDKKICYTLELNKSSYYCSETILGLVTLKVNEKLKINSLKYCMHGETSIGMNKTPLATHLNVECFLLNHLKKATEIEIGEYYYPFEFVLPLYLHPSFKHSMVKTEYNVRLTLNLHRLTLFNVFKI